MDFEPMSPDEMQRTMQFLLDQQAKLAVDFDRLTEKTGRIADGLIGLTAIVGRVVAAQEESRQRSDRIYEAFQQHLRRDHGYPEP